MGLQGYRAFALGALLLGCNGSLHGTGPGDTHVELAGAGYVHYHLYPDTGQCYCGVEFDFTKYHKMIAAASESIHHHFGDSLCTRRKIAIVKSETTGKTVRVALVDKGGQPTDDFNAREQHIMDLSREAFDSLDADGAGVKAGRIYVIWEIIPAESE